MARPKAWVFAKQVSPLNSNFKMPKIDNVRDFLASPEAKNYEAMIEKDAVGRRLLLGFKRKSKRSRKRRVAYLLSMPVPLDEIVAEHEKYKRELAEKERRVETAANGPESNRGADDHDDAPMPSTGANDLADGDGTGRSDGR